MRIPVFPFLLMAGLVPTRAATTSCPKTCESALSYIKFSGNNSKAQCTNELHIISYYACLIRFCPSKAEDGYSALQDSCENISALPEIRNVTVQLDDLAEFTLKDIRKKTSHAGLLSPSLYALSERTIKSASQADELNQRFGNAIHCFWGIILLLTAVARFCTFVKTQAPAALHIRRMNIRWPRTVANTLRRHILIPKILGPQNERNDGWCAFPTRLQSLVVMSFVTLNVILHLVSHDVFEGNLKRPRISTQVARSLGHRTGYIIMANLPIMWTFAMRNNILTWLSGWSFATFNIYHRWIARVIVAELIAHAVAYTLVTYDSGGSTKYKAQWSQEYWIWGVIALIVGCLTCITAVYPLRRRFYDVFLLSHIVIALLFLIGTWFHLKKSDDHFVCYFWPCVAVWAFDRAMRFGRLIALNRSLGGALVTYDPGSDMLRLKVPVRSIVRPQAGTYYYIYIIHGPKFWESHPFTLSSWMSTNGRDHVTAKLQFLIRPHAGFTARLKDLALQDNNAEDGTGLPKERKVLALVEGPYGHTRNIHSYDSALFVVGGSGVTVAMAHLRSLVARFEREAHLSIRKAHVIWAIRHTDLATSVLESEIIPYLASSGLDQKVEIHFETYVTQNIVGATALEEKSGASLGIKELDKETCMHPVFEKHEVSSIDTRGCGRGVRQEGNPVGLIRSHEGRPPLREILMKHIDQNSACKGRLAVVCCGPPAMSYEVGMLVARALKDGANRIDYFPESFSW